jgi:putative nucleotidyltransferase with HDIG domain
MTKRQLNRRKLLVPVPVATLQGDTLNPVDLYLETAPENYVLYRSARIPLEPESLERLQERGVKTLYCRKKESQAYYDYVERNLQSIIAGDELSGPEAGRIVYETASRTMADLFENPRSGQLQTRARRLAKATVTALVRDPDTLWDMTAMAGHDYQTYTHCVNVSLFLAGACQQILGIDDADELEDISVGGVLHDIGKSKVPESILKKPGKLTDDEFQTIKEHPLSGLDLARQHKLLSKTSENVILRHHERKDGSGYPDGLGMEDLDDVARLSTIVDVYDALTTDRPYADARTPYEALKLMMNQMEGHFDMSLLRRFVNFLGSEGPNSLAAAAPAPQPV